jgi:hypothetical protein
MPYYIYILNVAILYIGCLCCNCGLKILQIHFKNVAGTCGFGFTGRMSPNSKDVGGY